MYETSMRKPDDGIVRNTLIACATLNELFYLKKS